MPTEPIGQNLAPVIVDEINTIARTRIVEILQFADQNTLTAITIACRAWMEGPVDSLTELTQEGLGELAKDPVCSNLFIALAVVGLHDLVDHMLKIHFEKIN